MAISRLTLDSLAVIYGYARVSTKGQAKDGNSLEEQEKTLRERGAGIIFREAYTGAKGSRPELDRLLAVIQPGDTFMVTKMDRFARNTKDALAMVEDFRSRGIRIHILNMGLVDDTAMGRLMVTMLAAFAEYERAMIMERTQSGKAIAKERPGFKEGRPCACIDGEELRVALASGLSKTEAAKSLGISRSTLYRLTA